MGAEIPAIIESLAGTLMRRSIPRAGRYVRPKRTLSGRTVVIAVIWAVPCHIGSPVRKLSRSRRSRTRGCRMDNGYVRHRIHIRGMSGELILRETPGGRWGLSHRGSDGCCTWRWRVVLLQWGIGRWIWRKVSCFSGWAEVARCRTSRTGTIVAEVGDMAVSSSRKTVARIWDPIERVLPI